MTINDYLVFPVYKKKVKCKTPFDLLVYKQFGRTITSLTEHEQTVIINRNKSYIDLHAESASHVLSSSLLLAEQK